MQIAEHLQMGQHAMTVIVPLDDQQRPAIRICQFDQLSCKLPRWKIPVQFCALNPTPSFHHLRTRIIAFRTSAGWSTPIKYCLPACGRNQIISRPLSRISTGSPQSRNARSTAVRSKTHSPEARKHELESSANSCECVFDLT